MFTSRNYTTRILMLSGYKGEFQHHFQSKHILDLSSLIYLLNLEVILFYFSYSRMGSIECVRTLRFLDKDENAFNIYSHRTTLSMCKPVLFWQEKCDAVVILVQGFTKMLSCRSKLQTQYQFWHIFDQQKG